ncbi:hypothetical protein COL60_22170 [Bacillus pseudomycoides]|nr:hypothetical protein COL60_22170 [Bacillus pseudomycoides]
MDSHPNIILPYLSIFLLRKYHSNQGSRQPNDIKPTLRACKILYSFSANPVTNENPKTTPG